MADRGHFQLIRSGQTREAARQGYYKFRKRGEKLSATRIIVAFDCMVCSVSKAESAYRGDAMLPASRPSLLCTTIILFLINSGELRAGTQHHELKVNGLSRTFHVFVPDKLDRTRQFPLVIALHGGATNGEIMERFSGLSETAAKHSFIVAYPNGTGRLRAVRTWNSGRC